MNSEIYQLTKDNIDICTLFYKQTKETAEKIYSFYLKYLNYTKEYHNNLKNLLNNALTNSEEKEDNKEVTINKDKDKNNVNEISDENNWKNIFDLNTDVIANKKIIPPLSAYSNKIFKFFNDHIFSFELIINSIESPLANLKSYIEKSSIEISEIQKKFINERQIYLNKYANFESSNNNLMQYFLNMEKCLVDFCIQKKENKVNIEELNDNLNSKVMETLKFQNLSMKELDKNNTFTLKFKNQTDKHMEKINEYTISLFGTLNNCFNNFIIFLKKSQSLTFSEINTQIESKKDTVELEIKNLLNENLNEIKNERWELKYSNYVIKIFNNKNYFNNLSTDKNDNSIRAKSSFTPGYNRIDNSNSNQKKSPLNEEDIYFIAKKMYNSFIPINRENYSLDIEYNKIEIKKISDKILSILINKNPDVQQDIIKEIDINNLCYLMNKKEYINTFMLKLNNFRNRGIYELPKSIFEMITKVFLNISKNIIIHNETTNIDEFDLKDAKLLLILSQTFYCLEDSKKIYIFSRLKNQNIFKSLNFWETIIKYNIKNEIKRVLESENYDENTKNEKINDVVFSQAIAYISFMKEIGISVEDITKVIFGLLENYKITQITKDNINTMIIS